MDILNLLMYFFLISVTSSKKSDNKNPRLIVRDGNLVFVAASDKKIEFETISNGVSINGIDIVSTLNKVYNTSRFVNDYQNRFSSYVDRLESVEQRILYMPITNSSAVSPSSPWAVRRLRRSVIVLAKKVNDIETALLQNNCAENPCQNGGTCQNMYKDYVCRCADGWEGRNCLEDVNECARFVGTDLGCQNLATCVNKPGTYECLCPPGFVGMHCTRRKAECSTAGEELCGHGTCVQQNGPKSYKCICDQGWTKDGTEACTADVNECNSNHPSCSINPKVACVNVPGSYYCGACPTGYSGNGYHCSDINECETNNGGCSTNPMVTCINTQGSRICGLCPPGYEGDGVSCLFRGVCNVNNGGCHYLAQCRDNSRISSTYVECICPTGYVGNGIGPNGCTLSSSPFNPCASNPCMYGDCSVNNITGNYACNCRKNYTGRNCDTLKRYICASNPCQNGGTCQNVMGVAFRCICRSGFSGMTCEKESRGCGGKLTGTSGVLSYPAGDFETYGNRLSCAWTIETNSTKILNITFIKFDIQESTGCRSDWLQIHDGPNSASHSLGRFCGTTPPLGGKIISTHNIIYLWFRSDAGNAKTGFKLTWNATAPVCGQHFIASSHGRIESPGSPANYPPNRDCYWSIMAAAGKRLLFHFYSLNIGNNTDCSKDFIEFHSMYRLSSNRPYAKFCNTSDPSPFYSPSDSTIIYFHSDKNSSHPGFQITFSVVEGIPGCGGVYTADEGQIQSAQQPSTCEYKIQHGYNAKTKITFLNLNISQSEGCRDEYLELREGPNIDSPLVGRYCGSILPGTYISNSQLTIISSISSGSKWKLEYKKVCGTKFSNNTGSFASPSRAYKIDCIYEIEQPVGYVITLIIKVTQIRRFYYRPCMSYIEIRDGDHEDALLIKKICDSSSETITSTHNHLWIRYVAPLIFGLKFEATYTSTDVGCGGILRNNVGNIASPTNAEGLYYPPSLKCSWVIIAPPKNVIKLTWVTFNLEVSYDCVYDRIEVYDNNTDLGMGVPIGKYCGDTLPPTLMSSSSIMTITFKSDVTVHKEGFLATYMYLPESKVCGGDYFTPTGVIKSPRYPGEYSPSKDCTWTITVPSGQQISLNVIDFHLENSSNCRYDWLEIRNGGTSHSPLIGKYCGDPLIKPISSHTNKLYLHFASDPNRQQTGFKIIWSSTSTGCGGTLTSPSGSIISPNYPQPYSRNTECIWKIVVSAGSKIRVVFSEIDLESPAQCKLKYIPDYVQLFDGPTINSKSLGKFCSVENSLITSSTHEMLVQFRSDIAFQGRGFQLFYSTMCNRTLTGFRGVIESPNFPGDYPEDMNCVWHIIVSNKNKINITFSHFELEAQYNSSCVSDYIELKYLEQSDEYYDEEPIYKTQGKYCGSNSPGHITLDSDHAEIHFVSDRTGSGMGFRLEWQLFGCGGRLTHNTGTIQSPNYPKAYPASVKCEWLIEVDFGYSIEIQFHEIDVEKENCDYDWIQVYNGPDNSSNLLLKACYQVKPIVLFSTGNQMFIEFQADYSYQGKGFIANYTTMKAKCGGRIVAESGVILSPNYPKNYNSNDTCYWFIEVADTHAIELYFDDVDLPEPCNSTYIKVYDGPTEAYPVLSKICGIKPNDTIKSTFNELYIEFRASNSHLTAKGFRATYKMACGSRMTTQGSGNIEISRHEMAKHKTCTWTIVSTDPSKHVTLTISHMEMEIYSCEGDDKPLKIYGGETTQAPLLKTFCGNEVPLPIVTDGSAITIQLSYTMNFFATYSVLDSHCGGTFTSVKGFFASPGYSKTYPSNMECQWTITAAPGNHITLSFIEFDILESDNCNTDFLEIRKNNVSGPLLGVYCGKNKPDNLTHEGSLWMMFKSSELDSGTPVIAKGFFGEFEHDKYNELSGSQGIIASPLYPQNHYTYGVFSWKITVAPRKLILLTFKDFYFEGSSEECYSAIFTVYDGVDSTAPALQSVCGMDLPDPIKSTTNILFIQVEFNYIRMGARFLVEWLEISNQPSTTPPSENSEKECGSSEVIDINSNGSYAIKSPGYPGGYKPNLNCEWLFSTIPMNHLFVQFTDMNLENFLPFRNRIPCTDDYVGIYQKHAEDNDWELVNKLCNINNKPTRYDTTNLLKVQFISNRFFNGTGFSAYVEQSCGGSMRGPTGFITFNKTIISGYNCQWNVTVRSGKTIRVIFEEMNIAHDATKGCDNYLMLRNGKYPDSPILGVGKYCGTDIPEPLETTGNHLYIKFRGYSKIKGFKLKYQEESAKCGGEILLTPYDNSTEINSPNYPNIPLPHTECTWLIRAPAEELLRIDFNERFDLTQRIQCYIEYVEVRDGGTEMSPLIGRYCHDKPHTQFSSGNLIFIKFFTNTEDPRNGFKAKISLGYCGGTIRGVRGEIKSPTLQTKDNRRNCTWHISGPIDHYLKIQFTDLKIVDVPIKSNKITIFEKNEMLDNVTTLATYSGTSLPPVLTTSGNTAIVNYVGTNSDSFHLNFSASQTECGGSINTESGEIVSPGYPAMNHLNRYCQWIIEVPEGRRITLDFVDFDLDESVPNIQAVAVFEGSIPFKISLAYLRPGDPKRVIESSSNKMRIVLWSNRASLHRGFKARFSSNKPTICSSKFDSDSGILTQPVSRNSTYWCHWKHQNRNFSLNQTLALTITLKSNFTRKLVSMNCTYSVWSITVMNGKQILSSLCKPTVENYKVRSPYPLTEVIALARNQMNFTISYNTHNCGGIVRDQQGFLSSPNYPNKPSQSVECAWLIKVDNDQTVNLTVLSMDLGSDCERSYLRVFNGEGTSHPEIGKYCKTDKPGTIISQSNTLWIEYSFETGTTGAGFNLTYQALSEGCGGVYHDKNRIIQTPNYNKSYPNNAECLWEIRSSPGYSIVVKFIERFHIEDSNKCVNDYLEVWDWQYDKWVSIAKVCGRDKPIDIRSTGDKLKLLFRSNEKTTASGFKARWEWLCGGYFEATKIPRTIVSPGYPIVYTPSLNCVYNIKTKAEVLVITFDDFELETGVPTCLYDNVTISGNNYLAYSALQTTYCGTVKPAPLRVRGGAVITFKTDKWVQRKGFKFTYSDESCGGDINDTAIIQAPSFTYRRDYRLYLPGVKCVWKITGPPKQIAILRVLSLSLPTFCLNHGLEVFNGLNNSRTNRLASLCGNITDSNQPIHADSGNMLVTLNTNPLAYNGFRALVYFSHGPTEGCGGTVNLTETKTIESPDLEDLDCSWRIIAPKDHLIQIHFTELNIPSACNKNTSAYYCTCSFIEVRDGGGSLSELIEKLCSSANHSPEYRKFNTSSNYGYIRMVLEGRQSNTFKAVLTPVLSQCGITDLNATNQVKTLTSPNYPNTYPPGVKCTWVITAQNHMDKIELHFVDFNLIWNTSAFINVNNCDRDRVEIMEDPNKQIITEGFGPEAVYQPNRRPVFLSHNNIPGLHTFCGSEEFPFDYYSIGRSLSITFASHMSMQKGRGFKLEYRIAGCNRNYTSLQGRLLSTNGKSNCIITITVPENRTISLYFQKLMIDYSRNCTTSAFEVRDNGPNGALLVRSCGFRIPDPVFSFTNKLYIHIASKNIPPSFLSYDVGYTSTDAGRGCGGELYNYKGWVSSPLYPNEFRNSTECTWAIRVPVGLSATLKFVNLDLQGSCYQTYISVTTYTLGTPTTHKFCKDDRPAVLRSTSKIDIKYQSSVHNGGRGWLAIFQGISDDITVVN